MNYNLGRILPIYRGEYEVGTTYNKLDIVYVSGYGSYVAKQTVASVQPQENPEIWQLVAADCTNAELEETFNTNEAEREQRVNAFISTKSQELATLIAEVNNEVNAKMSEVDSALDGIDGEWETMKNTMNNQFNAAQTERESTFETNEEQRENTLNTAITNIENSDTTFKNSLQSETSEWLNEREVEFNEAQTERATEFNSTMVSMNGQFNTAQANRTTTFNNSETARQTTFETNETARQNEFDSKEADRDEATQTIINEHDYLVNLDNTKANKDGYYSTLTAGAAENLVGDSVDSDTYLIRPTGGDNNEVANGVASVLSMEGNTCVWNQMISIPNTDKSIDESGVTITDNRDGSYTIYTVDSGATAAKTIRLINGAEAKFIINHKYFITGIDGGRTTTYYLENTYSSGAGLIRCFNPMVFKALKSSIGISIHTVSGAIITTPVTIKPQVIDLTLLGYPDIETTTPTVAQVEEWLAQHVGTKPYYAYNEGTILSAQTLGIKTYGQNLLNPTTRQAKLIPYEWEDNSNVYTIKNIPSGATATFTPDNTGVAVSIEITDDTIDITNYDSGVLELSAATANTYVCMKWNSTKDNDVVPYEDHTYDFDVRKVYGKIRGAGMYVQCYPEGMTGMKLKDVLDTDKCIKYNSFVNLGDLDWSLNETDTGSYFSSNLPTIFVQVNADTLNDVLRCSRYVKDTYTNIINNVNNKSISYGGISNRVCVYDTDYSDADVFKSAMNGVYAIVQRRSTSYITYTDLIYSEDGGVTGTPLSDVLMNITVNNWGMEEQLMTPYENGNPTSISATISTIYGINAVEALDTLQRTTYTESDIHSNLSALLSCINNNCSTILGGTFSISDTATNKVFTFTFTQNEEGEGQ